MISSKPIFFRDFGYLQKVASLELRKRLQYRFDFWITTLGSAFGQLLLSIAIWSAIYTESNLAEIGGYTFHRMVLYYLVTSLVATAIAPSFVVVADQIYRGELSKYLLYPVSVYWYHFAQHIGKVVVTLLQGSIPIILFLLCYGVTIKENVSAESGLLWAVMSITSVLCSIVLLFTVTYLLELIAFWADAVWALVSIHSFVAAALGGALLPLSVFPQDWIPVLKMLPFASIYWFPTQTILGYVSLQEWVFHLFVAATWVSVYGIVIHYLWRSGCRRYTGVGI